MCDYLLMGMPNRLARKGEELVTFRFWTGSLGLIAVPVCAHANSVQAGSGFWSKVEALFRGTAARKVLAVYVPPGARLSLRDIPRTLQRSLSVSPNEEVTFMQLTPVGNTFRDAFRFKNGAELLLQRLNKGQRVKVLELDLVEEPLFVNGAGVSRPHTTSPSCPAMQCRSSLNHV
jgi:hypothetical protein